LLAAFLVFVDPVGLFLRDRAVLELLFRQRLDGGATLWQQLDRPLVGDVQAAQGGGCSRASRPSIAPATSAASCARP